MKVMFRFKPDNDKAWIGYTEGDTWEDIFMDIDEFGDPYSVDVFKLPSRQYVSFCVPYEYDPKEDYWVAQPELELGGFFLNYPVDAPEWETPNSAWENFLRTRTEKH